MMMLVTVVIIISYYGSSINKIIGNLCSTPKGVTTLSWWGGLCVSMTPRAMSAGVLYSWEGHPCRTGRRVETRRSVIPWSSRLGVELRANHLFSEKNNGLQKPQLIRFESMMAKLWLLTDNQPEAPGRHWVKAYGKLSDRRGQWRRQSQLPGLGAGMYARCI